VEFLSILKQYHALSIVFGVISAFLWLASAFSRSKKTEPTVPRGGYSMLEHIKTAEIQGKWNSSAAIFAALAALSQAFGI
jgi:hypothetical protein